MKLVSINRLMMAAAAMAVVLSTGCVARRPATVVVHQPPPPPGPVVVSGPPYVRATGYSAMSGGNPAQARLMAQRGAKVDAERNLLEQIKGVQLESGTYVRDFITQSDEISTRVRGYIRNARVVSEGPQGDGTYAMTLEMDMRYVYDSIR